MHWKPDMSMDPAVEELLLRQPVSVMKEGQMTGKKLHQRLGLEYVFMSFWNHVIQTLLTFVVPSFIHYSHISL